MTTKTELRIEALRLAVATTGNSNNVQLADEYLTFLSKDVESNEKTAPVRSPDKGRRGS